MQRYSQISRQGRFRHRHRYRDGEERGFRSILFTLLSKVKLNKLKQNHSLTQMKIIYLWNNKHSEIKTDLNSKLIFFSHFVLNLNNYGASSQYSIPCSEVKASELIGRIKSGLLNFTTSQNASLIANDEDNRQRVSEIKYQNFWNWIQNPSLLRKSMRYF